MTPWIQVTVSKEVITCYLWQSHYTGRRKVGSNTAGLFKTQPEILLLFLSYYFHLVYEF